MGSVFLYRILIDLVDRLHGPMAAPQPLNHEVAGAISNFGDFSVAVLGKLLYSPLL